jgi:hypothetical protein
MVGLDSRRQPGITHESVWRQAKIPVLVCFLLTLGLVMKQEITEVALHGADVSTLDHCRFFASQHFCVPTIFFTRHVPFCSSTALLSVFEISLPA